MQCKVLFFTCFAATAFTSGTLYESITIFLYHLLQSLCFSYLLLNHSRFEFPKNLDRRKAVSAVILRLPLIIYNILVRDIFISLDNLYAIIPNGSKNSSLNISHGLIFDNLFTVKPLSYLSSTLISDYLERFLNHLN